MYIFFLTMIIEWWLELSGLQQGFDHVWMVVNDFGGHQLCLSQRCLLHWQIEKKNAIYSEIYEK